MTARSWSRTTKRNKRKLTVRVAARRRQLDRRIVRRAKTRTHTAVSW